MALRGTTDLLSSIASPANTRIAKPSTAIVPFRAMQVAWISNSSSKGATAEAHTQSPGLVSTGPSGAVPSKKIKGEVPLPSQEAKKGAMQFALYVLFDGVLNCSHANICSLEQRSIKSPIGLGKAHSGP